MNETTHLRAEVEALRAKKRASNALALFLVVASLFTALATTNLLALQYGMAEAFSERR